MYSSHKGCGHGGGGFVYQRKAGKDAASGVNTSSSLIFECDKGMRGV